MNNMITGNWIDRYSENELNAEEMKVFHRMAGDDPLFRAEVNLELDLNRFLEDKETLELRAILGEITEKGQRRRSGNRLYLLAACLAVLLVITAMILLVRKAEGPTGMVAVFHSKGVMKMPGKTHRPPVSVPEFRKPLYITAPREQIKERMLMDDSYVPDPAMDLLSGSVTRSGGFILMSPDQNLTLREGSDILFAWKTTSESKAGISLQLLDNRCREVILLFPHAAGSLVLKTSDLKPGLYYWKILEDDDFLMVGRITILSAEDR